MPTRNGYEKLAGHYERPPPSYSEVDDRKTLSPAGESDDENVKQVFGMRRSSFLLSLYLVFYGVYLITGGLVFAILEGPGEEEVKVSLLEARMRFLEENPCVKDESLEELIEKIVSASNRGVSAVGNVSGEPNWNFGQSLFFASTVVTTIGYGHVTPLSKAGKAFCIIYAVFGIPLTLMLLTALVERLMIPSALLLQYLDSRLRHLCQPFNIRILHLFVVGSVLFTFFWFVPAGVFTYLEPEWDYLDSMYYCFISLTTIGLGDYIPGDSPDQPNRALYKILTIGYLLSGLVFLMFTLTVFYDIPQLNFGLFFLMQSDEKSSSSSGKDPEKLRLNSSSCAAIPRYTQERDDIRNKEKPVKTDSFASKILATGHIER